MQEAEAEVDGGEEPDIPIHLDRGVRRHQFPPKRVLCGIALVGGRPLPHPTNAPRQKATVGGDHGVEKQPHRLNLHQGMRLTPDERKRNDCPLMTTLAGIHYLPNNKVPTMPGARKADKAAILAGAVEAVVCGDLLTSMNNRPLLHGGSPFRQPQNPVMNKKIFPGAEKQPHRLNLHQLVGDRLLPHPPNTPRQKATVGGDHGVEKQPHHLHQEMWLTPDESKRHDCPLVHLPVTLAGMHNLHTNKAPTISGARKAAKAVVLVGAVGQMRGDLLTLMNE